MFPPGLEPGTFRVLGGRDDHYTTETVWCILSQQEEYIINNLEIDFLSNYF